MTLLLTDEDMEELLNVGDSIAALRSALDEQATGLVQMPTRQTMDALNSHNWLRISTAFLNRADYMGFKSMNRAEGLGMRYLVALYRISSGELVALMDANLLTTHRTAATSAIGTDLLAPSDSKSVGIIGSGVQAKAFLRAYAVLRPLETVAIFSPREESRLAFAEFVQHELGIAASTCTSPETLAQASDTIVLAMRAPFEPVFRTEWLRPGVHVTGLSSVRKEAREVEDGVWRASSLVVADDRGTVFQSGDGLSASASDSIRPEDVPELWELIAGRAGRAEEKDVTLFKSAGCAMQDIAVAVSAFERASERGLGRDLGTFPIVKPYA